MFNPFAKWLAKPAPRVENAAYSAAVLDAFGVTPAASGMAVTPVSAMRVAAVFACVQKIAGAIATLPIHVYRTDGDIKVRLPRDDLWFKLNEQPSPQYTAASHWEGVSMAQLLRGDGYTWIRRGDNNGIRELLPLPWSVVRPELQNDGSVKYFIDWPERKIKTWVEPAEILHFSGFGFDGIKSMSVITHAAKAAVGNALAMDEYSGKFFANGAHPSISLEAPAKMSTEQIEAMQQAFARKYSGLDNAHKFPLVLTEGIKAKELSLSAEDAQLLEARKFQVIDIARAFGVPPHMIGSSEASTSWGTGIESMSRGFVTYTLQPHLVRIEQELNRKLFVRNAGKFVQFDREALIEGDAKSQAEYNRAALGGPGTGMGWKTPNEVRKDKGLAPLPGSAANELFDPRTALKDQEPKADPAAVAMASMASSFMAIANKENPASIVNVTQPNITVQAPITNISMPEMQPSFEATIQAQPAPVVNVTNEIQVPTVQVDVVNQVNPAAVEVTNNVQIEPAQPALITLSLPDRISEATVKRDASGSIINTTTIERDLNAR